MNFQQFINDYVSWIKDNTTIRSVETDKVCAMTTPFLDRHNDHIEIYIKKESDDSFILTDDGNTVTDLKFTGVDFNTPKRQSIFNTTINGLGIKSENDELFVEANNFNIAQKKHYLIQAILAINDMYVLSKENVYSLFKEDVATFFAANNIYFTKDIKLTGKSGFDHNVDFAISASRTKPERLIKTIASPKKDPIMAAIFAFNDIAAMRDQQTKNYVIFNDADRNASSDILSALRRYEVEALPWSQRDRAIEEFALV